MIRFENDILSYLAASIHRPHRVALGGEAEKAQMLVPLLLWME